MPSKRTEILRGYARRMIENPTLYEDAFATRLAKFGIKFEMQVVIEPYIVDFLIASKRLIIELDGAYHKQRREYDKKRDAYLRDKGYRVLRMRNRTAFRFDLNELAGLPPKPRKKKKPKKSSRRKQMLPPKELKGLRFVR